MVSGAVQPQHRYMQNKNHFMKRVLLTYLFTFVFVILFIPFMFIDSMGGHSIFFMTLLGSVIGATLGMSFSDFKLRYYGWANLIRTLFGFVLIIAFILLLGIFSQSNTFMKNQGWIFIPIVIPLFSAIISNGLFINKFQK